MINSSSVIKLTNLSWIAKALFHKCYSFCIGFRINYKQKPDILQISAQNSKAAGITGLAMYKRTSVTLHKQNHNFAIASRSTFLCPLAFQLMDPSGPNSENYGTQHETF